MARQNFRPVPMRTAAAEDYLERILEPPYRAWLREHPLVLKDILTK